MLQKVDTIGIELILLLYGNKRVFKELLLGLQKLCLNISPSSLIFRKNLATLHSNVIQT